MERVTLSTRTIGMDGMIHVMNRLETEYLMVCKHVCRDWNIVCTYIVDRKEKSHDYYNVRPNLCTFFAEKGHLELILWASQESYTWWELKENHINSTQILSAYRNGKLYPPYRSTLSSMAANGHLDMLTHFHRSGVSIKDPEIIAAAARGGQMDVLEFLRDEGCPWDERAVKWIASQGNVEMLQIVHDRGAPWAQDVGLWAVRGGSLSSIRKVYALKGKSVFPDRCAWYVGMAGNLEMLRFFFEAGFHKLEDYSKGAAHAGHLSSLEWLMNHGYPMSDTICLSAVSKGNLDMLIWARRNDCEWSAVECATAVKMGNFEILEWLHNNGCPWDEKSCEEAALKGDLETLKWLRSKGCPWNGSARWLAQTNDYVDMLHWMRENGCDFTSENPYTVFYLSDQIPYETTGYFTECTTEENPKKDCDHVPQNYDQSDLGDDEETEESTLDDGHESEDGGESASKRRRFDIHPR